MLKKPSTAAAILAVATVIAAASPVLALARVTRLVVSDKADATGATGRLPLDTEVAYIVFDYEGASNEKLTVSIEGLGLSTIVAKSGTYSGNGTATVQFTGAEVFQSLVARVAALASQAQSDVKRAAEQELGRRGYIEAVALDISQIDGVIALLGQIDDLPSATSGYMSDIAQATQDLGTLVEAATASGVDDATQKAKAEAMKVPVASLAASADDLADTADSVSALALPRTGSEASFTAQVSVGGNPSSTVEFWVVDTTQNVSSDTSSGIASPTSSGGSSGRSATATPRNGAARTAGTGATATIEPTVGGAAGRMTAAAVKAAGGAATTAAGSEVTAAAKGTSVVIDAEAGGLSAGQALGEQQDAGNDAGQTVGLAADSPAAGAAPTWTVPASGAGDGAGALVQPVSQPGTGQRGGATGGPSLAVFALGAAALVGVALWLRGRT